MNAPLPGDEAKNVNEELAALVALTDRAISTLDLDELLEALLERLVVVMKADAGAVMLEESGRLVVRCTRGLGKDLGELPTVAIGDGFGGRIAATGRPMYIADAQTDHRVAGTLLQERGVVSMLGVPLTAREERLGVLHVDWCDFHAESETDLHLLETAAERCAMAIANARLYERLRETGEEAMRVKDRLTLAVGAAQLGVWDWDVQSGDVVWDATNERIFGLREGGFDGRVETFRSFVHPEDLERVQKAIAAALEGARYAISFRIVRRDGEVRWLAVQGHFQRTPVGNPLRLLGVTEDVTEERHLADERELLFVREQAAREQLRALSARIRTVREDEAVRIGREIHDELGQLLTALRMDVSWIRSRVERLGGPEAESIVSRANEMSELTQRTIRSVQRISEELRPAALDQLGLEAAIDAQLAALKERSGIVTRLAGGLGERRLKSDVETGVFRIVQELLTNVARHAEARHVGVELRLDRAELTVIVADDGRGISADEISAPRSLGLVGIRERALLLGGSAALRGVPGRGTEAVVKIPVEASAP
jgi:PAS domain S-box-containing protein